MKKFIGLVLVLTLLVGCSTAGRLVASSSSSVDHAMQGWAVLVVDGKTKPAQEERVRNAHTKYLKAEDAAVEALGTTNWASAKVFLVENQNLLLELIETFKKEAK